MNDIRSKNQIDKLKIKRLKLILPIFLVIFVIFIILQYVSTKKVFVIDDSDISNYSKSLTLDSTSGVIKPLLTGNTSDGSFYRLTANRASPLGPELKDIELERVNLEFYDQDLNIKFVNLTVKYLASTNSAILFDNIKGKTFDGYSFIANSQIPSDTSFILVDGPVIGGNNNVYFEVALKFMIKGLKFLFIRCEIKLRKTENRD